MAALSIIAAACGSSEGGQSKPDGGKTADAGRDARASGSGGAGGAGHGGAGGTSGGAGVAGMLGTGCTLGDGASDVPSNGTGNETDASLVMDISDSGIRDGSAPSDAGASPGPGPDASVDAGKPVKPVPDAGQVGQVGPIGPVTTKYPPLQFSDIGQVNVVSSQFLFTEGPVWDPATDALYFTDINGDAIYRLKLPDTLDVFADHLGNPDGLALDTNGDIIGAGYVSRDVWRLHAGKQQTLVSQYKDRKLNTPDEVVVRSDGIIYFTDPTFGLGGQGFSVQPTELCFQGVYRLTSNALYLEDSTISGPNGINFSPDEKILYVSSTTTGQVFRFDVAADGSLHNKTMFAANITIADSMCVDAGGNVYVASFGGITVLDPTGKQLGVIQVPGGQVTTNCAFGGPDQRTFFITARGTAALVGTPVKGDSVLLRIDNMPIPGMPGRP
jgi:gluconolactonase